MAVGFGSKTFTQATLCFALTLIVFAPVAHAAATSHVDVDWLLADCMSDISSVPLQTRLFFDDKASLPVSDFLTGTSLRLERAEGNDAHIRQGPLGPGYLYSNYRSEIVETTEYGSFELDLAGFFDESNVVIMPQAATTPGWATMSAPDGFEVKAPAGETVVRADPRDPYNSEPPALWFSGAMTDLTIGGQLRLLIEQTEFNVHANGKIDSYSAENERVTGDDTAMQVNYFLLYVTDARIVTKNVPVAVETYADLIDIHCVGTIFDAGASTPGATLSEPVPIASGFLSVSPRRNADRIDVGYTTIEAHAPAAASSNIGIAPSAFPYWGFLTALGFVATGGGVAAWRVHRKHPAAPESVPTQPSPQAAPRPKPGARSIPEMEHAYRQDPGNTVTALELGLAYARNKQPHDALPLLQLAIQEYPKMDAARYFTGIALLQIGRIDDGLRHLAYSFRLNALNVARFINEGDALAHGHHPRVRIMLARWSRQFQESNARGYV